jgi:hypothetical protein
VGELVILHILQSIFMTKKHEMNFFQIL